MFRATVAYLALATAVSARSANSWCQPKEWVVFPDDGSPVLNVSIPARCRKLSAHRLHRFGDEGCLALARALETAYDEGGGGGSGTNFVTSLDLRDSGLGDAGAAALAHALLPTSAGPRGGGSGPRDLTDLSLGGNAIGTAGVGALAHALKNNKVLTALNLVENDVRLPRSTPLPTARVPRP
jgi:hypothetical protein